MLITWVTTVSSSGSDDNVMIKISHGIVVKMTTKIFTVFREAVGTDTLTNAQTTESRPPPPPPQWETDWLTELLIKYD